MADGEFHITFNSIDLLDYLPDCFSPWNTAAADPAQEPELPDEEGLDGTHD